MKVIPEMRCAGKIWYLRFYCYHMGRYLCWWTIIPRGYHPPRSQYFYHMGRYLCWWTISPRGYQPPSSQYFYHMGRYLCWWTISPLGYHPPSSQCFYHWVDTSAAGLLVPECILCPVVSVSITGLIPLLVDY